jgi:hypothetical protein
MPTAKLTKKSVETLESPAEKQIILWDSEIRGFGVRAMPSGLKTFVVQYRNKDGTKRRINLGRFGVMTVDQARDLAKVRLGEVASGVIIRAAPPQFVTPLLLSAPRASHADPAAWNPVACRLPAPR